MTTSRPDALEGVVKEHPQTLVDVVGAEIIRARSVRSTTWLMLLGILSGILLTIPGGLDTTYPMTVTTVCVNLALTTSAVVVFAVLSVTDEYSLNTLITTVAAVPNRARLLHAKLIVAALFAIITVGTPLIIALITLSIIREDHLPAGELGYLSCIGVITSNILIGLFGVLLGACVRNSTLGVVIALVLIFLVPVLSIEIGESGIYLNDYGISSAAAFLVPFDPRSIGINIVSLIVWITIPAIVGIRRFTRSEV